MENNTYSVYMHTFPNNKKYIGITCLSPTRRWGLDGRGYQSQHIMWAAIQEFGWSNIKHEILFYDLSEEEAKHKEEELIIKYKTTLSDYGYNIKGKDNKDYSAAKVNTKPHQHDIIKREQLTMLLSLYKDGAVNILTAITSKRIEEIIPTEKSNTSRFRFMEGLIQAQYVDYGLKYGKFYSYFITQKGIELLKEYSLI